MGQETASEGRFGYASRHLLVGLDAARADQAGVRAAAGSPGAGPDPHGAAARVGRVRARHPLQGHDPRRARARLRPPVHARGRAARARRPRVLHDPRPAPDRDDRSAAPSPRTTTRGSARASWPRSSPGSTPMPGGRGPITTRGSPGCCSSWASRPWPSSATRCARWTRDALTQRMNYRYPPGAVRRLDDALLWAYGDDVRRAARQRRPRARPAGQAREDGRGRLGVPRRSRCWAGTPDHDRARSAPGPARGAAPGNARVPPGPRPADPLAGPSSDHHRWVQATSPSEVSTSVVMSCAVCPGVAISLTDGESWNPSAARSVQVSPRRSPRSRGTGPARTAPRSTCGRDGGD